MPHSIPNDICVKTINGARIVCRRRTRTVHGRRFVFFTPCRVRWQREQTLYDPDIFSKDAKQVITKMLERQIEEDRE